MITSTTNTVDLTNLDQAETYGVRVTLVTHKYGESAKSKEKKFSIPEDKASTANAISKLENKMVSILYYACTDRNILEDSSHCTVQNWIVILHFRLLYIIISDIYIQKKT